MKIAFINDQHFGAHNDSPAFAANADKFYDSIFFPALTHFGVTAVVNGGDLLDRRKYINYKTLNRLRNKFIYRLRDMNIEQHHIIGNHDTFYKNTNKINAVTELFSGTHGIKTDAILANDNGLVLGKNAYVYHGVTEVIFDNIKFLFVPWICEENEKETLETIQQTDARFVYGHLELQGFEMYKGQEMFEGHEANIFSKFEAVYTGHYHTKSTKGNVTYLGAPCEYTWSDFNDERGFHIFDTDTCQITRIVNPYRMFHKIVYDDTGIVTQNQKIQTLKDFGDSASKYEGCMVKVIVEKKNDNNHFEDFLGVLFRANPADVNVVDTTTLYVANEEGDTSTTTISNDTLTVIYTSVENAPTLDNDEKINVKSLMSSLYNEALSLGGSHG